MRGRIGVFLILAVAGSVLAAGPPAKVMALRKERRIDKQRFEVLYQFEEEHVTPAVQAAKRGAEAAKVWKAHDKSEKVAVIARSPFGGGETAESYWPAGVKAELLQNVVEPLTKLGLKVALPALPSGDDEDKDESRVEPLPKIGFSEDYEFVLVIGLHHEPIPHRGTRRTIEGKVIYSRSSRVNAWAILFHAPTATAFWGAIATAQVEHRGVADLPAGKAGPLNLAAEAALGRLDFADVGSDNLPACIKKFTEPEGLETLDAAAMLAQTQRADAAEAIVGAAVSEAAFKNTAAVIRYFSQRGVVQDYRISPAFAERRKFILVSQPVMVRILLLEQIRGVRGIQPCSVVALVPRMVDYEVPRIGRHSAGRLRPLCGDDEIVLIGELANSDRRGIFSRNRAAAVRNLGRCRVHVAEAMAVARFYAERKTPRPKRGKPRRDYLKEAGIAALKELKQAKVNVRQ